MIIRTISELRNRRARAAGFTLIEILLVIVIILLLAGALVVFVLPQQEGAEKNTTRVMLGQVAQALDTYRLNLGHYPTEEEGGLKALTTKPTFENERLGEKWQGPYLKPGTRLDDPWGSELRYEAVDNSMAAVDDKKPALPYRLSSIGPDRQPDTDDDIFLASDSDTEGAGDAGGSPSTK